MYNNEVTLVEAIVSVLLEVLLQLHTAGRSLQQISGFSTAALKHHYKLITVTTN